jgi:hypothetical protein
MGRQAFEEKTGMIRVLSESPIGLPSLFPDEVR